MIAQVQQIRNEPAAEPSPLVRRLEELRRDYAAGQRRLEGLDTERHRLCETMLKIVGGIQVLEELNSSSPGADSATA
jgi:predicted nuclease with TOPRIM domain